MDGSSNRQLIPASHGRGELLQRDYWAVVEAARLDAPAAGRLLAERFCEFPPPELLHCSYRGGREGPLRPGDELTVEIRAAGSFGVRVIHRDGQSLTLGTLEGHPEAGRITFGVYRNDEDDLIIHIRSRARSSSTSRLLGFLFAGEPMQTTAWSDFLERFAATVGDGVLGVIHAETREVEEGPDDRESAGPSPTFLAR